MPSCPKRVYGLTDQRRPLGAALDAGAPCSPVDGRSSAARRSLLAKPRRREAHCILYTDRWPRNWDSWKGSGDLNRHGSPHRAWPTPPRTAAFEPPPKEATHRIAAFLAWLQRGAGGRKARREDDLPVEHIFSGRRAWPEPPGPARPAPSRRGFTAQPTPLGDEGTNSRRMRRSSRRVESNTPKASRRDGAGDLT